MIIIIITEGYFKRLCEKLKENTPIFDLVKIPILHTMSYRPALFFFSMY